MPSARQKISPLLFRMLLSNACQWAFCLSLIIFFFICERAGANDFAAAVVKVDITPDNPQMLLGYQSRQSTGVHDKIHHKTVALDDGKTQFFIISSDLCVISPSEYDRLAGILERTLKISPLQVWWTVTHTHSAPEVVPPGLPAAFLGERYMSYLQGKMSE